MARTGPGGSHITHSMRQHQRVHLSHATSPAHMCTCMRLCVAQLQSHVERGGTRILLRPCVPLARPGQQSLHCIQHTLQPSQGTPVGAHDRGSVVLYTHMHAGIHTHSGTHTVAHPCHLVQCAQPGPHRLPPSASAHSGIPAPMLTVKCTLVVCPCGCHVSMDCNAWPHVNICPHPPWPQVC